MTDIRKFAVASTSTLHLRDANDELMYATGADGKPDESRPMVAVLYGPGSKPYRAAQAKLSNRNVNRYRSTGKADRSAADIARETAEILAACTVELQNIELDQLEGNALFMAVYTEPEIGFITEQVNKYISDWANFSKISPKS